MGQTLATAAQWTSASKDGGIGKLELTAANEAILNKIVAFVDGFSSSHSAESQLAFKQPLTWVTELSPTEFLSGYTQTDDQVMSESTDKSGQPFLVMSRKGNRWELAVSCFAELENVVRFAGQKKITETRLCLEANRDPVAKMLGDRFATISGSDDSAYRYIDEIMRTASNASAHESSEEQTPDGNHDEVGDKKLSLKLLLLLKDFDDKLLQEAIKIISSEVKLSPPDVERMFNLLKRYSGPDQEKHVLKQISWLDPYTFVFNNGCRAPFWRQLKGDISYLMVVTHDSPDPIYLTAGTHGYFVNGGPNPDGKDINFDVVGGNVHRDLIALLREKSPHFVQLIDQQEIFKEAERSHNAMMSSGGGYDTADGSGPESDGQHGDRHHGRHHGARHDHKGHEKKKGEHKKKLEPSMKWKALEVDGEHDKHKGKCPEKQVAMRSMSSKKRDGCRSTYRSDGESSFEESSSESEDEDEVQDRRQEAAADLPSEFWQIQKLIKYLKGGNQTATIIALCSLRDFNLQQEACQMAIRDVGGIEILINLLDTDEIKCKIGALKILKEITTNALIRRTITDLGGLQTMVKILREQNKELKCLAAETIANIAHLRRARRSIRQHGGIKNLVALLDSNGGSPLNDVARSGALALWSCSKSERNKLAMRQAGVIPLLAKLLRSNKPEMLIPVVGTLQECASDPNYRLAIRTEGMIGDLVRNLHSNNTELQMHCASAIFKCAQEKETRDLIRKFGGLDPLVSLIGKTDNKELLAAATGAIWKCSISPENVARFQELKTIDTLVSLLGQPEEVLVNVVGALAELAKDAPNRLALRKANGIPPLINLLTGTNPSLLVNVTKAVGQCACEPDNMVIIDKLDGVRLLWSLLKNQNPQVQASAAWAICPCIENAKDSGEMVRSFVGGLELVVSLLRSDNIEVLSSVCAAIACIAVDEENLAVITDHGVVPMLAHLTSMHDDTLRRHLAEAIARCCGWSNNRVTFGTENAVVPLVKYLFTKDPAVHRSTARALHQLSKDPDNCIAMHEAGVVRPLLDLVGSDDPVLQEAAAGCLSNIRRLALANEKARTR